MKMASEPFDGPTDAGVREPTDGDAIVIIGAGPAGLAAADRFLEYGIRPVVVERDSTVGGISKTVAYKGNRIDIGGHRFFSKNERVTDWWLSMLPLEADLPRANRASDLRSDGDPDAPRGMSAPAMLVRSRLSRIYFDGQFYDYPVTLSASTLRNLGIRRMASIVGSYAISIARPIRPERSLEDFMINRFGRSLYELFFRDYTEKVWGVPCAEIPADWGAQRIRGVSISAVLQHAISKMLNRRGQLARNTETSLIDRFLYPQLGPGQLWEEVARSAISRGAVLRLNEEVTGIRFEGNSAVSVRLEHAETGQVEELRCSALMSTMPLADFVRACSGVEIDVHARSVADGLPYRDFVTCGLLVSELAIANADGSPIRDNWIYIQDRDVRVGRLQVFNNWSPFLCANPGTVWLGLEYFCDEGDDVWSLSDSDFVQMASAELSRLGIIEVGGVLDGCVLRVPKAYPAYFGTYRDFDSLQVWLDSLSNVFFMGRNGTHRYNNMDHSVLSAWAAVDAAVGRGNKRDIWAVNADEAYQEDGG